MLPSPQPTAPIRDVAELRRHFAAGEKPRDAHRVGVEHEKIAVVQGVRAPDYERVIGPLLEELSRSGGWERVEEAGRVIALKRGRATVTLEPGGQVELSDEPRATARGAAGALAAHLAELTPTAEKLGITFLGTGFRPFGTLEDVPWMPKGRYRVMREWMPKHGTRGLEMMKRTTTVQANLDYSDEADCADKLRTAMGITSLVTALWASSPLVDGKDSGFQSYRAYAWLSTDDARCGLLPFVFADGGGERIYDAYLEWALDVPMFFVLRDGNYVPVGEMTFRRFLAEGFGGDAARMGDWEIHLSTLFPEVRLKQYIEVRGADAGPLPMVAALPALYRGLLYDRDARRAAWQLVSGWRYEDRLALRAEVPRAGIRATVAGKPIAPLCAELVKIAHAGLARLGDDDLALLAPIEKIAAGGPTVADEIRALHAKSAGDPAALVRGLALSAPSGNRL
jgi:glutamate--cysteine ligase